MINFRAWFKLGSQERASQRGDNLPTEGIRCLKDLGERVRSRHGAKAEAPGTADNDGACRPGRGSGPTADAPAFLRHCQAPLRPLLTQHLCSPWGNATSFCAVLKWACLPLSSSLIYELPSSASWQAAWLYRMLLMRWRGEGTQGCSLVTGAQSLTHPRSLTWKGQPRHWQWAHTPGAPQPQLCPPAESWVCRGTYGPASTLSGWWI